MKKDTQKENFEEDVMDLIKTTHQIYMTSEHSVSSNKSFKIHSNSNSFKIFWESCNSCAKRDDAASVFLTRVM